MFGSSSTVEIDSQEVMDRMENVLRDISKQPQPIGHGKLSEFLDRDDDADSELKKAISLQYGNCCDLAKRWMYGDQQQNKKMMKKKDYHDMTISAPQQLDTHLLLLLDDNLKYDIVEFIPTYSRWPSLKQNDQFMDEMDIPYDYKKNDDEDQQRVISLQREEHVEYARRDQPIVTYHKMRLVSKAFNNRMMRSILQVKEIILNSSEYETDVWDYFLTFLRKQRLFKEGNGKLLPTSDGIYLYRDGVEELRSLSTKKSSEAKQSSSLFKSTGISMLGGGSTTTGTPSFFSSTNTSGSSLFGNFGSSSLDDESSSSAVESTDVAQKSESGESITTTLASTDIFSESLETLQSHKGIRQKRSAKNTSVFNFAPPTENYTNAYPISQFKLSLHRDIYNHLLVEEFIGENTTIERLVLLHSISPLFLEAILNQLKKLKKLDLLSACKFPESLSHQSLEEITTMRETAITSEQCIQLPNLKKIIKLKSFEVFTFSSAMPTGLQHITEERQPWQIIEYLEEFHPSLRMILIENFFRCDPLSNNSSFSFSSHYSLVRGLFQTPIANIERAKEILDYIIKTHNFPCESIMITHLEPHTDTCQCLLQYFIYLCNEYQNGRLMNISSTISQSGAKIVMIVIDFGWHFWKQHMELPFFVCGDKKTNTLLNKVLELIHSKIDEEILKSIFNAYLLGSKLSDLESIISFFLLHNIELLTKTVIRSVKCTLSFSQDNICKIPLIGLLFVRCNPYGGLLLESIIDHMSIEDFESVRVEEKGDNILHLYLKSMTSLEGALVNVVFLLKLLRKSRKLATIPNNEKLTPLQICQKIENEYFQAILTREFLSN